MRLYGNVINRMMEGMTDQPTPEVGMPITVCMWSDRVVYNITEVISPKRFIVDGSHRVVLSGSRSKDCQAVTLRKNGQWRFEGDSMDGGAGIIINRADAYYDPHF